MRATDVVDGLRDLVDRMSDPYFANVVQNAADRGFTHKGAYARGIIDMRAALGSTDGVECYQVAASMVPLVQIAAESLDGTDTFRFDFAPSPHGFVQFETPLVVRDIRERTVHISWVQWGTVGGAMWIVAFADARQPDEIMFQDADGRPVDPALFEPLGWWRWTGIDIVKDGWMLTFMGPEDRAHALDVVDNGAALDSDRFVTRDEQLPRFLKALWLLMAQTVGDVTARSLDRAGARRAARRSLPTRVTVVELRRPRGEHVGEAGEGGREWSVRWMVKGHFAWRACGELHPLAEPHGDGWRARVWISPYAKNAGRDDLPWRRASEKVYVLKR